MLDLKHALKLDLEDLRTFVAVAQLHSFSATAEELNKTTSAISYRIKTLENNLGVALLERTTRSVQLTPSGEVLLEKASQILSWLFGMEGELKQTRDGVEHSFTLVINNLLYDARGAAHLLADLHQRFQMTTFNIEKAVYMGVWDAMIHGEGQFAIGAPGFHSITDEFVAEPLGLIDWVFVAAPTHPVAQLSIPLSNEIVRRYPVINIEDTSQRLQKRPAWRLHGQQELLVADINTKIACHEAGLGLGFLPAVMAHEAIRNRRLAEVKLATAVRPPTPFSLVWHRQETGQVGEYLRKKFTANDPLITPFLRQLSPVPSTM